MDIHQIDVAILCGGLGMRLRPEVGDTPKVMAPVGGHPFLDILVQQVAAYGFERVILMTGYKADVVEEYFRAKKGLRFEFSREDEPLGTGGALKNARPLIVSDPFIVLNGDSFCSINFTSFLSFHRGQRAVATIAVAEADDKTDYGSIEMDSQGQIVQFREKEKTASGSVGFVNAGIYCFSQDIWKRFPSVGKFSLEKDLFPGLAGHDAYGYVVEEPFMDIGTPERYHEAMKYLKKKG